MTELTWVAGYCIQYNWISPPRCSVLMFTTALWCGHFKTTMHTQIFLQAFERDLITCTLIKCFSVPCFAIGARWNNTAGGLSYTLKCMKSFQWGVFRWQLTRLIFFNALHWNYSVIYLRWLSTLEWAICSESVVSLAS